MNISPRPVGAKAPAAKGRPDPVGRPVEGTRASYSAVKNADPNRSYVLQYLADVDGFTARLENGWLVENYREGGPMVGPNLSSETRKPYREGDQITYRGHVLMSIEKEVLADHQMNGSPNEQDLGQAYYDRLEKRILNASGDFDPLRGTGRFMRMVNEIGANEVETDI